MNQFFVLFLSIFLFSFSGSVFSKEKPTVLVSIAPYKFFVEKIALDTVDVIPMVPPGASAHTYEPTPKQILSSSNADLWFSIGEGFEAKAIKAFTSHNPRMQIIDLRQGVDLIRADPHTGVCCCHANCEDLHIWLSARQGKIQAATIAKALMARYPQNAELYKKNLEKFTEELDTLDKQISHILKSMQNRVILVSHPAYAYFCRDYSIVQMSIEFEGKDPTPLQLNNILNKARMNHIRKIYIQPQYSGKGAKLIAREIGAQTVMLEPYAENYYDSMLEIAHAFSSNDL